MVKTRNILLIGKTGGGKSTLANVITGTEKFIAGNGFTSTTDDFQEEFLEWKGIKYRIVDTVGLGDNSGLSNQEVLFRIAKGICLMRDGLSRAFFVIDGRFTENEKVMFEMIKNVIFHGRNDFINHVTIVRTKFEEFDDEEECEKNSKLLRERDDAIGMIARECKDIIYVNNPSTKLPEDFETKKNWNEKKKINKLKEIEINKEIREESREKLLTHLEEKCQSFYCPSYWEKISLNTYDYISKRMHFGARVQLKNLTPESQAILDEREEEVKKQVAKQVEKDLRGQVVMPPKDRECCHNQ